MKKKHRVKPTRTAKGVLEELAELKAEHLRLGAEIARREAALQSEELPNNYPTEFGTLTRVVEAEHEVDPQKARQIIGQEKFNELARIDYAAIASTVPKHVLVKLGAEHAVRTRVRQTFRLQEAAGN